jgi:hypothetical protein
VTDTAAAGPGNEGADKAAARPQQQQRRSYVVPMALPHGAPPLLVRPPSSSLLRSRGDKEEAGGSDRSRPVHQRDNEAAPTAAAARTTTAHYTLYGAVPLCHTTQSGGPIDTSCLAGGGDDDAWPPTKHILGCPHCGVTMTSRWSNYWSCDVCDTRSNHLERTSMCCRDCDFDYCRSCYHDARYVIF